jgi:hypothetical protein
VPLAIATPAAAAKRLSQSRSRSRTARLPPAARKRFRNLKCGASIQRGFTYRVSDNFKIICGYRLLNRVRCDHRKEFLRARPRRLSGGKRGRILGAHLQKNRAQIRRRIAILNIRNG